MPSRAAASAIVSLSAPRPPLCASVRSSPISPCSLLYPSEYSRKPLEAILVRLAGIHRGFVACCRGGCPAVGHQCLHNKTALYRRVRLVGGAGYTSSPNAPSGRQSARRRGMSGKPVAKQTPLKCLDCKHEFDGFAMHKEHYVES